MNMNSRAEVLVQLSIFVGTVLVLAPMSSLAQKIVPMTTPSPATNITRYAADRSEPNRGGEPAPVIEELLANTKWMALHGGTDPGELVAQRIAKAGSKVIEPCLRYAHGTLDQRKTAMQTLAFIAPCDDLDMALPTVLGIATHDPDYYVRNLAERVIWRFTKKQCLTALSSRAPEIRAVVLPSLARFRNEVDVRSVFENAIVNIKEDETVRITALAYGLPPLDAARMLARLIADKKQPRSFRRTLLRDGIPLMCYAEERHRDHSDLPVEAYEQIVETLTTISNDKTDTESASLAMKTLNMKRDWSERRLAPREVLAELYIKRAAVRVDNGAHGDAKSDFRKASVIMIDFSPPLDLFSVLRVTGYNYPFHYRPQDYVRLLTELATAEQNPKLRNFLELWTAWLKGKILEDAKNSQQAPAK